MDFTSISFMIMRLRERRLPQSTEAVGLQGSEGLNGFLEAVHREGSEARTPEGKGGTVPSTGTTCCRLLEAAGALGLQRSLTTQLQLEFTQLVQPVHTCG